MPAHDEVSQAHEHVRSERAPHTGAALDQVLQEADLAAGDFVRWAKQTIDLLDQLTLVAAPPVAATARAALDAVRRGIVVYGSL